MAQRFFQNDAEMRAVQSRSSQLLADGAEQGRGSCQVHDDGISPTGVDRYRHGLVVERLRQIHSNVFEQGGEPGELLLIGPLGRLDIGKLFMNAGAVLVRRQIVAPDTDDAAPYGQGAVPEGLKKSGHQLAPCQVTRTTKKH